MKEYILYCDESKADGKYYGNFYGGVLSESTHQDRCVQQMCKPKRKDPLSPT